MKNILVIQGGRSRGNTAQLIDNFVAGAKEAGRCAEVISLIKNGEKAVWDAARADMITMYSKGAF